MKGTMNITITNKDKLRISDGDCAYEYEIPGLAYESVADLADRIGKTYGITNLSKKGMCIGEQQQ